MFLIGNPKRRKYPRMRITWGEWIVTAKSNISKYYLKIELCFIGMKLLMKYFRLSRKTKKERQNGMKKAPNFGRFHFFSKKN